MIVFAGVIAEDARARARLQGSVRRALEGDVEQRFAAFADV